MTTRTQIYVALLDEGVDVWRPVQAKHVGDALYRIVDQPYDGEDEKWEFEQGSLVRAIRRRLDGSEVLVAVAPG